MKGILNYVKFLNLVFINNIIKFLNFFYRKYYLGDTGASLPCFYIFIFNLVVFLF